MLVCKTEYNLVRPYRVFSGGLRESLVTCETPADPPPSRHGFSSPPFSFSQQAFNATAVVRHMRKLQLGTSQEGQGQTASHGELLTPTAGGKHQGPVGGDRWSMKAGAGAAPQPPLLSSPHRASSWLLLPRLLCGARLGAAPCTTPKL